MAGPEGKVVEFVYGAFTEGQNELSGNKLTDKGGVIADSAYGAYTPKAGPKTTKLWLRAAGSAGAWKAGTAGRAAGAMNLSLKAAAWRTHGGYSSDGPADDNKLVVRGGTIADDAQAGLSLRGSAANNTLTMEGARHGPALWRLRHGRPGHGQYRHCQRRRGRGGIARSQTP